MKGPRHGVELVDLRHGKMSLDLDDILKQRNGAKVDAQHSQNQHLQSIYTLTKIPPQAVIAEVGS